MLGHKNQLPSLLLASALVGLAVLATSPVAHAAAIFTVVNNDGAGEGFNDPSPRAPVGGNTGTTLGQQRLIAFQHAANLWGERLTSTVAIRIQAQFNALSCTAMSGILGSAGFINAFRDFVGAPVAGTWYPVALANALSGSDLDPGGNDITATFNSNVGTPGCLETSAWYYGLDGNPPGGQIDFATVLLHELGHGLGFASLVDLATGTKALGFNDTYSRNLENHGASPPDYPSMSNAQRVAASISTGNLHWTGANVRAASGILSAGKVGDHVRLFAPNPQQPGSSVSHWDTAVSPDQLLEPSYTVPLQAAGLEIPLFNDLGWTTISIALPPPPPPPSPGQLACSSATQLGDFNADNRKDLVFRRNDGLTSVYFMNGTQVASGQIIGQIGTEFTLVGIGDFNGDGRADLLMRRTDGTMAIFLMNGASVIAAQLIGNIGNEFKVVGVGDFNGDGRADFLTRRPDGLLAVYLMNGFQFVGAQIIGQIGTEWTVAQVADFDGNGRADFLTRRADGTVAIYLMTPNGLQVASASIVGNIGPEWRLIAAGDFNGDVRADFLTRRNDGTLAIYLTNGTQITGAQIIGNIGTEWKFVGIGDLNADARADLVFRRTDGTLSAYLINGFQILSGQIAGNIGTEWDSCYGQGLGGLARVSQN